MHMMRRMIYIFSFFFMSTRGLDEALDYQHVRSKSNHRCNIHLLGNCPSKQDVVKGMNITAVALFQNALNSMSVEAKDGNVWITELKNSTWISTCTRLSPSQSSKESRLFLCDVTIFNLCSTRWEFINVHTK